LHFCINYLASLIKRVGSEVTYLKNLLCLYFQISLNLIFSKKLILYRIKCIDLKELEVVEK